jgi:hypothetical protein
MKFRAFHLALTTSLLAISVNGTHVQNLIQHTEASRRVLLAPYSNNFADVKVHPAVTTVSASAPVTTYTGNDYEPGGFSGDGGPTTQAEMRLSSAGFGFVSNAGIAFDSSGSLYIADKGQSPLVLCVVLVRGYGHHHCLWVEPILPRPTRSFCFTFAPHPRVEGLPC